MRSRISAIAIALLSVLVIEAAPVQASSKRRLVLSYTAEEGLNGRVARGAVFKAWIDDGRPVVAMTDDNGKVALDLGRPLDKGQTLYVEAESEDGSRSYSWIYKETPLSGTVESACQLVGLDDFHKPTLVTADSAVQ